MQHAYRSDTTAAAASRREATLADATAAQRRTGQGNDGVTAHGWELAAG